MNSLPSNPPNRNYINIVSIYGLIDPETEQIHYIGKSVNPKSRHLAHMHDHAPSPKTTWIQDLIKRGLSPQIRILEEVPRDQGEMREIYWMNYYLEQGHPLTNVRDNKLQKRKTFKKEDYSRSFAHQVRLARKTYYSSQQCDQDIMTIKQRYGISGDSDVIRFALRMLASADLDVELHAKKRLSKRRGAFLDIQHELF